MKLIEPSTTAWLDKEGALMVQIVYVPSEQLHVGKFILYQRRIERILLNSLFTGATRFIRETGPLCRNSWMEKTTCEANALLGLLSSYWTYSAFEAAALVFLFCAYLY